MTPFGRRLADALLDAREEALRAPTRRRPSRRTRRRRPGSARSPARRGRTCRGRRSASCSGPRPWSCRGSSRGTGPSASGSRSPRRTCASAARRSPRCGPRPVATRSCSPVARALDPDRRLLLEHPLERRAHLVEVGLRLRLDRDRQGRLREVERRQDDRLLLRRQRVAGLGHGRAWRPRRSRPPCSSPIGSWSLPWSSSSWPIRSSSSRFAFQTWAWRLERARTDPEVGQPADERVGRGLERRGRRAGRPGPG